LGNHPGILAEKREEFEFASTAIFSRFPNKNPENATLAKKDFEPQPDRTKSRHKQRRSNFKRQGSKF